MMLPINPLSASARSSISMTSGPSAVVTTKPSGHVLFDLFLQKLQQRDTPSPLLNHAIAQLNDYMANEAHHDLTEKLCLLVEEANSSCVDRASFYFNQMYVAMLEHQLINSHPSLDHLFETNRIFFRMQQLEKIAANKVAERRQVGAGFVDEIEIYCAYQHRLSALLSLPIYTTLYHERLADINSEEINQAADEVFEQEKRTFMRYLVTESSSWRDQLMKWDRVQTEAVDNAYLAEIDSQDFQLSIDQALAKCGIASDDDDARPIAMKQLTDNLLFEKRYQLTQRFLSTQGALSLITNFDGSLQTGTSRDPITHSVATIASLNECNVLIDAWKTWAQAAGQTNEQRHQAVLQLERCIQCNQQKLDLSSLNLTELPTHWPKGIQQLDISRNQLTLLPSQLPSSLRLLNARYNQLTHLPPLWPPALVTLDISHNKLMLLITSLPSTLIQLNTSHNQLTLFMTTEPLIVKELSIQGNPLAFFPEEIKTMKPLKIDYRPRPNWLSLAPDIIFINEIKEWVSTGTWFNWVAIKEQFKVQLLGHFLHALRKSNLCHDALKPAVAQLLDYAGKQEVFRQQLFRIIEEVTISCAAGALYSFNQMYRAMMAYQLMHDQPSTKALIHTNRLLFRMKTLHQLALHRVREKYGASRFIEEIETYLNYQSHLQQRLSLPIGSNMRCHSMSQLDDTVILAVLKAVNRLEQRDFERYLVMESASWQVRLTQWDRLHMNRINNTNGDDLWIYQQRAQLSQQFLIEQGALSLVTTMNSDPTEPAEKRGWFDFICRPCRHVHH